MRKRKTNGWYRSPRTRQELRRSCRLDKYNQDSDETRYIRDKRTRYNIPTAWDDVRNTSYKLKKSWKEKRQKQYYGRSSLKEFHIEVPKIDAWRWFTYTEYLDKMNIPYRIVQEWDVHVEERNTKRIMCPTGKTERVYYFNKFNADGTKKIMFVRNLYELKHVPCKPYTVRWKTLKKETIIYWHSKELIFN